MSRQIILASESFLKNFIFEKTKIKYVKMPADIDERQIQNSNTKKLVAELSVHKCKKIADFHPHDIVIAADTIMVNEQGKQFHKPKDKKEAFEMCMSLSGQVVDVYTGVSIYEKGLGTFTDVSETRLAYINFTKTTLNKLIENDESSIRSGALGFFSDSPGFTLVEDFNGSYTGAMGLPMEIIYPVLHKIGVV